ncbi:hypothetical protein CHUAL_007679 [Chamberlinius hualienensis]
MQRHRPNGIMDGSRWCIAIFLVCFIIGTDGIRLNFWNSLKPARDRRQTLIPVISNHPNGATSINDGNVFFLSQPATAAHAGTLHQQQAQQGQVQGQHLFHVNVADNTAHFIPQPTQNNGFLLRQGQSQHFLLPRPLTSSTSTRNQQLPPLPQLPQSRPPVVHQFGQSHLQAQAQTPQHQQQRPPQQNNFRPFFNQFEPFDFEFNRGPHREQQQNQPIFRPLTSFPPQQQQQQQQQQRPPVSTENTDEELFFNFNGQRPLRPAGPIAPQPSLTGLPSPQSSESNFQSRPDEDEFVNDIRFPGPPDGQLHLNRRPTLGQSQSGERQPGSPRPSNQPFRPSTPSSVERFPSRPVPQPPRHPSFDFEEDPFAFHRPPPQTQRPTETPRPPVERPRQTQRPTTESSTTRGSNRGSSRFRPSDFGVDTSSSTEDQQEPESHRQQPPSDETESFGIPPPTDDFGSKLESGQFQTSPSPPRRPATSSPPTPPRTSAPSTSTPNRFQQSFIEDELPSSSPFPHHPPFHSPSRGQLRPVPQIRPPPQPQRPDQFFPQHRPIESQDNFRPDVSFSGFFPPPPPLPERERPLEPPQRRPIPQNEFEPPQRRPIPQNEFEPPRRPSVPPQDSIIQRPTQRPQEDERTRPPLRLNPFEEDDRPRPPLRPPHQGEDELRPSQRPNSFQDEDRQRPSGRPIINEEEDEERPFRPIPRPSATPELPLERRPFFGNDFQSRPPSNSFDGESRPTFGPQSVDQIQPPEELPITRQPFIDDIKPSTSAPTTSRPPARQRQRPVTTTQAPSSSAAPQRSRVTPVRVRSRTRRPITTTDADTFEVTSVAPRRRVRPSGARTTTTTTEQPSSSAPRRRVRPTSNQQRPQFRAQRKNVTRVPAASQSELSDRQVSASIQQQTRRPPTVSRSQITTERKPAVTRMVIKRRRPVTTTPPSSGIFDHSFTDHQLSPSRRKVSIVSKLDLDHSNNHHQEDETDTREPHIADSNERSSVTEVAAKVRDHSENVKPAFKTTTFTPTTTTTTTTTEDPTTTITSKTTTDSTTTTATTENATTKGMAEPEALNKLRNLLNRKFVFKTSAQSPTK